MPPYSAAAAQAAHCWFDVDRVPRDPATTAWKRHARWGQAQWREARGYPVGSEPYGGGKDATPVGSRLELTVARTEGRNFLTPGALAAVHARLAAPERFQMLKEDRLFADLLSSMPLCFNLFGDLAGGDDAARAAVRAWWPDAPDGKICVRFEHSPGRRDMAFLGNQSAFDVAFEVEANAGGRAIIGVETKYHEHAVAEAVPKPAALARYAEVTEKSEIFVADWRERILGTDLQQIWLDHLLVLAMLQHPSAQWSWGRFVLVYPAENPSFASAASRYRDALRDAATFEPRTLEALLAAPDALPLAVARAFEERYLPARPAVEATEAPAAAKASRKKRAPQESAPYAWELETAFQKHAFDWRPPPAVTAIKRAVSEIKKVAKKDPVVGAAGAVAFLELASPALERVDSSSGAVGSAVSSAIEEIAPVIGNAPVDAETRAAWLERLYVAHEKDTIPYIEDLADHWGELCATKELASAWADRLFEDTRSALSREREGFFRGISACLSALHRAERYDEILELLRVQAIWAYKEWAVRALVSAGRKAEAVEYAESCRSPWARDTMIDKVCEEILLSSGMADEAYTRYGLHANHASTYLATFRAITEKYPHKAPADVLADLAKTTPGDEGKWFAAAKHAELFDEALALAERSYSDPKTLTRAARDHAETHPSFAVGAGYLALHWLANGRFDITEAEVQDAYRVTIAAAEHAGTVPETIARIRALLDSGVFAAKFMKAALANTQLLSGSK